MPDTPPPITADDVVAAAIRFLDQFVSRGAAADVHAARAGLASDPVVRERLTGRLRAPIDDRGAFLAFRDFVEAEARMPPTTGAAPDLFELGSWLEWWDDDDPDQGTSDPAQWHDWLAALAPDG